MYNVMEYNPYDYVYMSEDGVNFRYLGSLNYFKCWLSHGFRGANWVSGYCGDLHKVEKLSDCIIYNLYFNCNCIADIVLEYFKGIESFPLTIYKFYDATMREIQPSWYAAEAFEIFLKQREYFLRPASEKYCKRRTSIYSFEFRKDPVPHTGGHHCGHYYRHFSMARQNQIMRSDPTFIKECGKERGSKSDYDPWIMEKIRHRDKNWKSFGKYRHQWEKHLPKHMDKLNKIS